MKFYKFVSYLFHPILAPIIGTIIFFIILPRHTSRILETTIISTVFIATYLLPLIILALLKRSRVIESYYLTHNKERKYPLFFYISMLYLIATLIKNNDTTTDLAIFFYGSTLSLIFVIFFLYKNIKVSLHMIGIIGMLAFFIIYSYLYEINNLLIISVIFILSGIVASSRLYLKAHTKKEISLGIVIGVIGQTFAYLIYSM